MWTIWSVIVCTCHIVIIHVIVFQKNVDMTSANIGHLFGDVTECVWWQFSLDLAIKFRVILILVIMYFNYTTFPSHNIFESSIEVSIFWLERFCCPWVISTLCAWKKNIHLPWQKLHANCEVLNTYPIIFVTIPIIEGQRWHITTHHSHDIAQSSRVITHHSSLMS